MHKIDDYLYYQTRNGKLYNADNLTILKMMPDESIDCIITSPPFWNLRDYQVEGQIGLESTVREYLEKLINIFSECKRVLKNSGVLWVNLGDSYYSNHGGGNQKKIHPEVTRQLLSIKNKTKEKEYPRKCLIMAPERFAIKMIDNGWILRSKIIWHKLNAMCESIKDRFTMDWEYVFFFTKNQKYYFKQQLEPYKTSTIERAHYTDTSIKHDSGLYGSMTNEKCNKWHRKVLEKLQNNKMPKIGGKKHVEDAGNKNPTYSGNQPEWGIGRNKRCVWSIPTQPFLGPHFAIFPMRLIEPMLDAGCPSDGIVMDPFMGSGTVALLAETRNVKWAGIELNRDYCNMIKDRIKFEAEQIKMEFK